MNPKKSIQPDLSRFFFTFVCGSLLTALPAAAQITLVNTGFLNGTANQTSYTLSFDAGNGGTADKLIVSAGTETSLAISSITYNGVALTLIPNSGDPSPGRNRGIWFLDSPFSTGAADNAADVAIGANLVATFSEPIMAGTGNVELWQDGGGSPLESFDVTSSLLLTFSGANLTINPTATLDYSSGYHVIIPSNALTDASGNFFSGLTVSTAWNFTTATPLSIDINVPDAGSFVVAGYNNSAASGATSVNSPLTSLHAGDFGGLVGAFGYQENVAAGIRTYEFTTAATGNGNSVAGTLPDRLFVDVRVTAP